jgi:hypothetical protein
MIHQVLYKVYAIFIYLAGRLRDVIVDRLLEAAIVALLAFAAGIPWLGEISQWFGRVLR